MRLPFGDRNEAGKELARRLRSEGVTPDLVLALPRGGVPVGFEVARELGQPLDVFVVRKLGAPGQPELAMGAIASGGAQVMNPGVVESLRVTPSELDGIVARESAELMRRERAYRGDAEPLAVEGRHVVVVDDGLATGASMKAAVLALRQLSAGRITVAVPVGAVESCEEVGELADNLICLASPETFVAVGMWYRNFQPVPDAAVTELLRRARDVRPLSGGAPGDERQA
ncbi:MAG: phosphoribosyltransferase [Dehalococcoidia bacterium]